MNRHMRRIDVAFQVSRTVTLFFRRKSTPDAPWTVLDSKEIDKDVLRSEGFQGGSTWYGKVSFNVDDDTTSDYEYAVALVGNPGWIGEMTPVAWDKQYKVDRASTSLLSKIAAFFRR